MIGGNFRILTTTFTAVNLLLASCAPPVAPTAAPAPMSERVGTPSTSPTSVGSPGIQPASPSPTPKLAAEAKSGGVLTASIYTDVPSLDPHQEAVFSTLTLAQPAMNGLIEFNPWDPDWKIRPGLAETWEISKDGINITFHLRRGVVWHDGNPFTSADAKFSLERAGVNPPKGATPQLKKAFEPVEKIETPDDYTLILALKYPFAEIMDVLAVGYDQMMPKHVIEPLGGSKIRKVEQFIGTGPFKLRSYDSGIGWNLVRNPSYFKKGLPYLDEIRYYIIKDDATRFSAFRTKRVLLESKSPGFSPAQKELLERSPETVGQVVLTTGVVMSIWGLWMNIRHPGPIGDVRVRKALHLAIDRQRMQKLFAQTQPPGVLGSVIYPGSKFAIPPESIQKFPGFRQPKDADIAEAKRLLDEAKLPKDFALTMVVREGAIYRDQATIVAEELKNLGVAATIKIVDTASWYAVQEKHDFAAMPSSWGSWSPSPHFAFADRFVTGAPRNYEGVSDERLDSLYAKQERCLDVEERKRLFWDMERIVREEIIPVAPFYWATKFTGTWKEVKGYPGMGLGYMEGNSMEEVWLDK